jgi:hypothetical protein
MTLALTSLCDDDTCRRRQARWLCRKPTLVGFAALDMLLHFLICHVLLNHAELLDQKQCACMLVNVMSGL